MCGEREIERQRESERWVEEVGKVSREEVERERQRKELEREREGEEKRNGERERGR